MKLLLLGATGRTGREFLNQALQAGITVNALVRDGGKVNLVHHGLTLFESKTLDRATLRSAMQGCDAVVSALNISRNSDFPWSALRTPRTLVSATIQTVIELAPELAIRRVIVLSAWGTNETKKDLPFWFRWLIDSSNSSAGYQDHERQEHLLQKSSLDYTILRPVILTNFKKDKLILRTIQANNPKPTRFISRHNVARLLLEVYIESSYVKRAVTCSER